MPSTMRDVAQLAGVSVAAVSKVVNNADNSIRVSDPTRQRILKAIRKLNYKPDIRARFLFQRRTQAVGFLTDTGTIATAYAHMILQRVVERFLERDYTTTALLYNVGDVEMRERIRRMVDEHRFDGLLVISADDSDLTRALDERAIPYIMVNPAHDHTRNAIVFDEHDNVRLAFTALLEAGHRRIGYLDYSKAREPHRTVSMRRNAYLNACRSHRIAPHFFSEDFADITSVRTAADLRPLPTGVIAYSLDLAQKFFARVYRNRRVNPQHFSIISAAEDVYQDRTPLKITGVALPVAAMADAAVEKLLHRIIHKNENVATVQLSGVLVLRETLHPHAKK